MNGKVKKQLKFNETKDIETVICKNCGEICDKYNAVYFDKVCLCEECYNEHTFICSFCGQTHWVKNAFDDGNIILCENCHLNKKDKMKLHYNVYSNALASEYIHDYSYKPKPIFYGKGIFYGVELEIDGEGDENETARQLLKIANEKAKHLYCKSDSSLKCGFELVTHPMTLQYHMKEMNWKEILQKCIDMGYSSYDTDTCGLHIHVGRRELGKNLEQQEKVIEEILFFLESHWNNLLQFSRRTETQINRWAARYDYKENLSKILEYAKNIDKRYMCLNLQNEESIEFRIFRGSLNYQHVIAAIQLVDTICNAAISMSNEMFKIMTWSCFLKGIDFSCKKELYDYLKEKELLEIE